MAAWFGIIPCDVYGLFGHVLAKHWCKRLFCHGSAVVENRLLIE